MKIPKTLKVGGLTFTIEIVDNLHDDKAAAITDTQFLTVKIEKAPQESMEATLWHEIIHMINREIPELDAEFLGRSLYQLIKDNKEVFK